MALITPNIGLALWNALDDLFTHDQLADNFAKVDWHDHSPGRGVQIPTEGIQDGAITAAKIAPGANSIANGAITSSKFAVLPAAKVYRSTTTSLPNSVETTLPFDTERFDNVGLYNSATNAERLVAPVAGAYLVSASITVLASPTAGVIRLGIYKNGTAEANSVARTSMSPNGLSVTVSTITYLQAGAYVLARVLNTTGATATVQTGSSTSEAYNDFSAVWMTP